MSEEVLRRVKHSWNERDTVGYECPIKEFVNRTTTQVVEERGERIYQAVLDIGIHMDKEELLKALQYDRGQYEKGFRDGQRNAQRWIPCSEPPKEDGRYLVTAFMEWRYETDRIEVFDLCYECGRWFVDKVGGLFEGKVLAWMPLPEPYREGDA